VCRYIRLKIGKSLERINQHLLFKLSLNHSPFFIHRLSGIGLLLARLKVAGGLDRIFDRMTAHNSQSGCVERGFLADNRVPLASYSISLAQLPGKLGS
jgi:hypothetical protein